MTTATGEIVARARALLEPERDVTMAVLFGSWARGTAHVRSDVDLAIAWRGGLVPLSRELALQAGLELALARPVDVVTLATASLALRWRIVRDGLPVLVRDPAAWDRLRIATAIEHDEDADTRQRATELQRRRLLAGGTR